MRSDLQLSSADLVYGTSLRLPAELCITTSNQQSISSHSFVQQLQQQMQKLKPFPFNSTQTNTFVHPDLKKCTHVFLRVDKVSPPLTQPYTGPHKVICRKDKTITIDINGRTSCVSLDRVKPAFVYNDVSDQTDDSLETTIPNKQPDLVNSDMTVQTQQTQNSPVNKQVTTKSGRVVRFSKRLITEIE